MRMYTNVYEGTWMYMNVYEWLYATHRNVTNKHPLVEKKIHTSSKAKKFLPLTRATFENCKKWSS